jgi:uncharacterized protein (TIGR02444 family)
MGRWCAPRAASASAWAIDAMSASTEAAAFWRFSLTTYRRPGVAPACLALQDRCGLDVNLLLLCLFAAKSGRALSAADLGRAMRRAAPIQAGIIAPLRAARRALKRQAELADPSLAAAAHRLRAAILRHELAAEHFEQTALSGLRLGRLQRAPAAALASANLTRFCAAAKVPLAAARRAGLGRLEAVITESRPPRSAK